MARDASKRQKGDTGGCDREGGDGVVGKKESALDTCGGTGRVFAEISRVAREKLKGRRDLDRLESYLRLKKDTLVEIAAGSRNISKGILMAIKVPLRLSLGDVIGRPERLKVPEVRAYWEGQRQTDPMKIVAFAGASAQAAIVQENPFDLESYVVARAVGEFYRLPDNADG